jgi:hyperosmotically inducible protein
MTDITSLKVHVLRCSDAPAVQLVTATDSPATASKQRLEEGISMRGMKQLSAVCAALVLMTAIGLPAAPRAEATGPETMTKVRRALERLPYYGVYDFLAFGIDNGVVTLKGYVHRPALKREAEEMVRHAVGADIANRIEVLPTSSFDDRIRWATYQQIYTDEIADRYVPGGSMETRYELLDMARFPGMEPYGTYPVHIIVKDRRVALIGVVISELDKTQILVRARLVPHTFSVEDAIMVRAR